MNYLKLFAAILIIFISTHAISQTKAEKELINNYLVNNELPGCFGQIGEEELDFVWDFNTGFMSKTQMIQSEYNEEANALKLYIIETCEDKNVLEFKIVELDSNSYLLVYEETDDHCCNYGELTKYEWKENEWIKGNTLQMSWENLFRLESDQMKSLKSSGEMPAVMFDFKSEGIYIELPWEYYALTFDEDTNAWLQGGAMKPFTILYSDIIKN